MQFSEGPNRRNQGAETKKMISIFNGILTKGTKGGRGAIFREEIIVGRNSIIIESPNKERVARREF